MFRKIISLLLAAAVVPAFAACGGRGDSTGNGKIKVSVSFNALKELTDAVGGGKVAVSVIIPDGTEPHDFEPRAQDLAALREAELFVINGLGMEAWSEEAVAASGNNGLIVVDASEGIETIGVEEGHDETGEEEQHTHGACDPHIWLSPRCAQMMAGNIKDALAKADPENSAFYEENYNAFAGKLQKLYNEYTEKFKTSSSKIFVTGHAAFAYLCRDFGLIQNSVEDVFAEGEPGARQLAALVDYCREHQITTIFTEALVSAAVSETLAREVGAQVKPIYTMASSENGKSYLERMEENLRVIYESLK